MDTGDSDKSLLQFQQLCNRLARVIKVQATDTSNLTAEAMGMEAGRILLAIHQFMQDHKGTPVYKSY